MYREAHVYFVVKPNKEVFVCAEFYLILSFSVFINICHLIIDAYWKEAEK